MSAHDWYVAAAYGASIIVLAGLFLWILADGVGRRRELAALEADGVRRRSDRSGAGSQ
jgi:heme exporter protein D